MDKEWEVETSIEIKTSFWCKTKEEAEKMAMMMAIDALSSSEKLNKWIPVSERLPEEREWYLTVFKEKDTGYQLIPRVADYVGENNWRIIDEDGLAKEYRDILECVAWMPLPKPYEPQESEEVRDKE